MPTNADIWRELLSDAPDWLWGNRSNRDCEITRGYLIGGEFVLCLYPVRATAKQRFVRINSTSLGNRAKIAVDLAFKEYRMSIRDEIAQQALGLPADDRAFVAELLERSLATGEFATPEIAAAWIAEVERRADAYERGEMLATDWRDTMARLRARPTTAEKRSQ